MNLKDQENSVQNDEQFSFAENKGNDKVNLPEESIIDTPAVEESSAVNESPAVDESPAEISDPAKKKSVRARTPRKVKLPDDSVEIKIVENEPANNAETNEAGDKVITHDKISSEPDKEPVVKEQQTIAEGNSPEVNYFLLSKEDLVKTLEELLSSSQVQDIRRDVESIKVNFYKKHRAEIDLKRKKFIEEGGLAEEFQVPVDHVEEKASELLRKYRDFRIEYNRNQDDAKIDNLRMRQEIIEEIKELINSEESINKTFQEFRELQNRWRDIGPVPQQNLNDLWETYHHHVEKFYDYININKELRDLDLRKNLESKILLCEKAETLILEPNVVNAFATLQKYHEQWREIGPVPKEKRTEVWERFKEATSKINKKHQHFYQDLKESQKKNLDSKVLLSEKAEEIANEELESHKDWIRRTNDILELQKVWKTIGFAPKKDNNRIYGRFRSACDKFFEKKRNFYSHALDEQSINLQKKLELCSQAESMMASTDWKRTSDEFIQLQKKWKEIGPAPRKHSEQVWKRFRTACDAFFARKSEFFSTIDTTFEKNLELKEAIVKDIENFAKTGNSKTDLEKLQEYQRNWTSIGFVPYDKKDELQQRYRDALNKQFDGLEVDEFKKSLLKFSSRIEGIMQKPNQESKLLFEREKYMVKLQQLKTDIGIWENNIGFFANSTKAEAMLRDFEIKIKDARETIRLLEEKITIIDELNLE